MTAAVECVVPIKSHDGETVGEVRSESPQEPFFFQ